MSLAKSQSYFTLCSSKKEQHMKAHFSISPVLDPVYVKLDHSAFTTKKQTSLVNSQHSQKKAMYVFTYSWMASLLSCKFKHSLVVSSSQMKR